MAHTRLGVEICCFCITTTEEYYTAPQVTISHLLPSSRTKSGYLCDGRLKTAKSARVQCKVGHASLHYFINGALNMRTSDMQVDPLERQKVALGRLN